MNVRCRKQIYYNLIKIIAYNWFNFSRQKKAHKQKLVQYLLLLVVIYERKVIISIQIGVSQRY
jgi:hypothetical protein